MTKKKQKSKKKQLFYKEKIPLLAAIVIIIAALVGIVVWQIIPRAIAETRLNKINSTYASFNIGDDYILQTQDVFGPKRVYDWDKSRSYSSSKQYIRAANVDATVADLQKRVTGAGFTQIGHPYPYQWQYKSKDNVYVRFNVTSKPRDDYFQNQILMNKQPDSSSYDNMNDGPSNVTLKVNLDDNNE